MNRLPIVALLVALSPRVSPAAASSSAASRTSRSRRSTCRAVSPLAVELRRNIAAASDRTTVTQQVTGADAVVTVLARAAGEGDPLAQHPGPGARVPAALPGRLSRVEPKGLDYVPPTAVLLTRDITFNDQVLAKETEEAQLYRDMRSDMVQQIMRRLARAKPVPAEDDE